MQESKHTKPKAKLVTIKGKKYEKEKIHCYSRITTPRNKHIKQTTQSRKPGNKAYPHASPHVHTPNRMLLIKPRIKKAHGKRMAALASTQKGNSVRRWSMLGKLRKRKRDVQKRRNNIATTIQQHSNSIHKPISNLKSAGQRSATRSLSQGR